MGLLNDISTTLKELREVATSDEVCSIIGSRKSSLSRKGTEGTLQFPNICSRALSIDHAIMINKALERQYAVFTQITLSLNPYLDLSKDKDVSSYLKKIHQNHKKGFLNTLGNNLIPVAFSSLALATKGTMSKIGAWGVAGYGLFTVLKEGFGLGKNTPVH